MKRLFVAQGSLHLITALVAGETCTAGGAEVPSAEDTILIHGLNPDREQSATWAAVLERAVRESHTGSGAPPRFLFLDPETVRRAERTARWQGWPRAARDLVACIGEGFEEIYIQRNREWINHTIVAAYPQARVICTGDGLGLNYSDRYWDPERSLRASPPLAGRLRERAVRARSVLARAARSAPEHAPRPRLDAHCLLLANFFDDQIEAPILADPARVRDRIDRWIPSVLPEAAIAPIEVGEAEELVVLVTSCFSEAGRIDRDREIEAYVERLEEVDPEHRALWVVKPHPRDLAQKTIELVAALRARHPGVHLLDDPARRYLPFEVTVRAELSHPDLPPRRFVTFSSASLALELLYGDETLGAFGEARVRRCFRPEFVETRLRHERDLERAVQTIRGGERHLRSSETATEETATEETAKTKERRS